ncbi:unnamed protein product [Arctogadus glacialis]
MTSGRGEPFQLNESCNGKPPVLGIVGDTSSTRTIAISSIASLYRLPLVSYFATCSCLSNRRLFPSFFRTIPSDAFQVRAILQILRRFNWTWFGLLISDDDYGLHAARSFQSGLAQYGGGCLAYLEVLPSGKDEEVLKRIVGIMEKSTSRVVIAFAHQSNMLNLMEEVVRQKMTGLQWIASEAWTTAIVLQTPSYMPFLAGTLGIAIRRGQIPGLRDFLLRIRPDNDRRSSQDNNLVKQFWEQVFQCKFITPGMEFEGQTKERLCTGNESLRNVETEFLDLSNLRSEYNVYKAVYALAHALHDILQCVPGSGPFQGQSCASLQGLEPWQLVYQLQRVNFTTYFGDQVSFDESGDALPIYDVINWMWHSDGRTEVKNVGEVNELASKIDNLNLDEDKIFWNFEPKKPPKSVCSESCPPGTRMARKKGEPVCCFDCIRCSEGEVSNKKDSTKCTSCPEEFWSNRQHNFNEAKFITFSMLVFCAVWIAFIPAYMNSPGKYADAVEVKQFWEHIFQCKFVSPGMEFKGQTQERLCTGNEILRNVDTEFLDLSNLRPEYNVYKAVYALAHALHDLLQCVPGSGPFKGQSCARLHGLEPWQLLYYMQKVNFTTDFGDHVSFDESGDVLPIYDVMNWMWLSDGSTEVKNPPKSVCSESCPPGTRMAIKKGEPVCCFDCIPCSEGKISNETDSTQCTSCPEEFWSNPQRDHCEPKIIEFLSYMEPLGISLTTASLCGALLCLIVLGIFTNHRTTPVVRANNSELSFLILLSLKLCFMCSLLFIGHPRLSTCQLRQAAFGISFVLCISCILVKTMVVLAVFKASKPGGCSLKWFGVMQQRGTVVFLTLIQAAICTTWIMSSSPTPHKNTQYYKDKIIVECLVGSTVGFGVLLGYIGLLAILSFLIAFLARNLPDNFNEAKFITFSMLVFCAVWVAFIPAYINSPAKYADAVEVFAILASSFGLLLALFGPKCYIIILKPEKNTRKALMGRGKPIS